MKKTLARTLALLVLLPAMGLAQNDATQLYGTVTTVEGNTYTGQIRWGKEEASWFDIFNGTKQGNPYHRYLSEGVNAPPTPPNPPGEGLDKEYEKAYRVWGMARIQVTHIFAVPFGAIARVEMKGRNGAELLLRDGSRYELDGESNDLGAVIQVKDPEIGTIKLEWQRIRSVEFSESPRQLGERFGHVLHGTVTAYAGDYTGFIQWDHDERLTTDKLDGRADDGDVSIDFGNIRAIERDGAGARVLLESGRTLYVRGSNDVNSENRGIVVYHPDYGGVDIPWKEFKRIEFSNAKAPTHPTYSDYKDLGRFEGTVKTKDGARHSGYIVYDLDEEASYELIQGKDKGLEYEIPIFLIRSIRPQSSYGAYVVLRNGTRLFLEDTQDVNEENDGILVFKSKDDRAPQFIRWMDIEELELR